MAAWMAQDPKLRTLISRELPARRPARLAHPGTLGRPSLAVARKWGRTFLLAGTVLAAFSLMLPLAAHAQANTPCGGTATSAAGNTAYAQTPIVVTPTPLAPSAATPSSVVERPPPPSGTPTTDQLDNGCITEFPTLSQRGAAYMIVGPDLALWFPENGNTIGRIDPNPPYTITEFGPFSGGGLEITIGADGNIWFAEQGSYDCNQNPPSRIARILARPPHTITEFPVPGPISVPYGIAGGPDGNLWFTRIGAPDGCSNAGSPEIDSISPFAPNEIHRYPLPAFPTNGLPAPTKPQKIVAGPDGNLWFNISPYIGSISPTGGHEITLFPIPGATGNFADINVGPVTDPFSIWFVPIIDGQQFMGRIGTDPSHQITTYPLNIKGGVNSVVAGPDGNIWFTEARTDYNIGRFEVAPPHNVLELPLPDDVYARAATCGPDGRIWFTELQDPLGLTGIPGKVGRVQNLPGLGTLVGRAACFLQALQMSTGGRVWPFPGRHE